MVRFKLKRLSGLGTAAWIRVIRGTAVADSALPLETAACYSFTSHTRDNEGEAENVGQSVMAGSVTDGGRRKKGQTRSQRNRIQIDTSEPILLRRQRCRYGHRRTARHCIPIHERRLRLDTHQGHYRRSGTRGLAPSMEQSGRRRDWH